MMSDFLFRGVLSDLDPQLSELAELEAERQYRRLILIPSESTSPLAVREALSSAFNNIYAEGYPDEYTRWLSQQEILDYETRLGHYRRYSDPRYYKGVEYADVIEALARRRCAETFAANGVKADEIFVNVQALSGAPANNAVYHALVNPGDTVMGMNLLHGGHLSHGSPVNRSGKYYNIIHYTIDPDTKQINYDQVAELARQHKPKLIISGFSSYPWQADWARMRQIADEVGAFLLCDMAHVAGLVAGGAYPSPIGYGHVITSTTHKTLCGPRGAIILTTDAALARKIDRAVFPGEQGGPHVNVFLALALTFKLAQSEPFRKLQHQIVNNCITFINRFVERGFTIPFGGGNTHMMNLDMKSIIGPDGSALSGDQAARILDLAGIVVNRNTIPGDRSALNPSGIRMGTPWVTQRGFKERETVALADIISDLLLACSPYWQPTQRAKVDFNVLNQARLQVRELALNAGIDFEPPSHGYPHFFYIDDQPRSKEARVAFDVTGERVTQFLLYASCGDVETLTNGDSRAVVFHTPQGELGVTLIRVSENAFRLSLESRYAGLLAAWLRDLSDGFVQFDDDLRRKLPGPVSVRESSSPADQEIMAEADASDKPYFVGTTTTKGSALPEFQWIENEGDVRQTALNQTHRELGAKMIPFAGWDMPVWYTSVVEEHMAVRQAAGLFDVSHMGVYQAEGPNAAIFLDSVCGNDIGALDVGQSLYTHLLDPDANVIDDLLIYRRGQQQYLMVVNASNDDQDWAWLNAVREGQVLIDRQRPWVKAFGRTVQLRNLRHPKQGKDMLVDIALQGPRSRDILLSLKSKEDARQKVLKLKRTELCQVKLGAFDLLISRTGYTGEKMAFELFVHPERSVELWQALLKAGETLGIKPVGLGARDSLRTEAGLPLYGHEMGGLLNLGVGQAGFGNYVKCYKPWFIGRQAYIQQEAEHKGEVLRFRFSEKGVRMAHLGDPVLDKRGKTIGTVTSCAIDSQGYLTGLAYVDLKYHELGTPIFIYQSASSVTDKAPADLKTGDRVTLPAAAQVVSRFAKL